MRRASSIFVLFLLLVVRPGLSAEIIVEARVVPEEAYLGQRILLQVDVLGSEGWTKLVRLPQVDVPGAYVVMTNPQGSRLQDTFHGVAYTGQRYEYSIYTQREGILVVPELALETSTSSWGPNGVESIESATTQSLSIVSKLPPGGKGISWLVATPSLRVRQEWSSAKESYTVGDSIKRTITLEATNLPGMAFPETTLKAPDGVRVYPHGSTTEDFLDRGTQRGKRIDSATFILESPGEYFLPELEYNWWNLQSGELVTESLAGLEVSVEPSAATQLDELTPAEPSRKSAIMFFVGLAVATGVVLLLLRRSIAGTFSAWFIRWADSERSRFSRIGKAARRNDAQAVLGETMAWLDHINEGAQPARLDEFLEAYSPGGESGKLPVGDLYPVLRKARRNWLKSKGEQRSAVKSGTLPTLNP